VKSSNVPYKIIGIDPGTNVLGYAVIEIIGKEPKLIELEVLHLSKWKEQQYKLRVIYEKVKELVDIHKPWEMAIEAPFYAKNIQSMLKLGRAQGVAMAAAIVNNVLVTEYSPKKIKQSVTGNGNASKEQVAAMLNTIFNKQIITEYLDATDAVAVALCHFYQAGSPIGEGKKYSGWSAFVTDNKDKVKK
jgi:crossover junction endodeoxyribonuclease RuvC